MHISKWLPSGRRSNKTTSDQRGLWIWESLALLANTTDQAALWQPSNFSLNLSDIYLYTPLSLFTSLNTTQQLSKFLNATSANGIRVWAMEGARAYFADVSGPSHGELTDTLAAAIAFNKNASSNEKFYGFHLDMEPADLPQYPPTFHNGIPDNKLNKTTGGEWYKSQAEDREMLMRDWVGMHKNYSILLNAAGMQLSSALPTWIMSYYGAPLSVTFDGKRDLVGVHLMKWMNEACIMSYRVNLATLISLVKPILKVASCRIRLGMEMVKGVGSGISYADTPGKANKTVVLADMYLLEAQAPPLFGPKAKGSFAGINVHDWTGWKALPN